jgi:hypothetical protein
MNGLAATFTGLRQASNKAARQLWLEALSSPRRYIRIQAFEAAIHGAPVDIQTAIFLKWRELKASERELVGENLAQFLPGLKASLDSSNETLRSNVFSIILSNEAFGLIPDFVKLIETSKETRCGSVGRILIRLIELMASKLEASKHSNSAPPDDNLLDQTRECLSQSIKKFHHHQRTEILISFLNIAALSSPVLHEVLHEPKSKALSLAADVLARRRFIDIPNRLVLAYLSSEQPPRLIQQLWETRSEKDFIRGFLGAIREHQSTHYLNHLQELHQPNWLASLDLPSMRLTTRQQEGLVELLDRAIIKDNVHRQTWRKLLVDGAEALCERCLDELNADNSAETDSVLISLAHHRLAKIRCKAIQLIHERQILEADEILFQALDDSDPDVVKAARTGLQKYSLEQYLKKQNHLEPVQKELAIRVIKKIETDLTERLKEQFQSTQTPSILDAVEITVAVSKCDALEESLIELLSHDSAEIRSVVCEALGQSRNEAVIKHLKLRLDDDAIEVCNSAQASLDRLKSRTHPSKMPLSENPLLNEIVETS